MLCVKGRIAAPALSPDRRVNWKSGMNGTADGGVEMWRGSLGEAYRLPTLSSVGASLAPPCVRFHIPLIEPDVRIYRIRLSEKTHAIARASACDAVCNA